jgi:hypothetical protein
MCDGVPVDVKFRREAKYCNVANHIETVRKMAEFGVRYTAIQLIPELHALSHFDE